MPDIKQLSKRRFDALAGYVRSPSVTLVTQEFDWLATHDERLLGVLTWDRYDFDFGWVILGRDERAQYRAIDVDASIRSADLARCHLVAALEKHMDEPNEAFYQHDVVGKPIDFFKPLSPPDRLNTSFKMLIETERYSPAKELIAAMMRFHEHADGNFIEQFQTTGFDSRLWELYLFATFTEIGYAPDRSHEAPDFVLLSPFGRLATEATTANRPLKREIPIPQNREEIIDYLENYIPIKLARPLRKKLARRPPYWALPHVTGMPFVLAIQDFHGPGTMRMIVSALTEYVFGVRHHMVEGVRKIEFITEHRWGQSVECSGFFKFPEAESVSAVIANPQGTITKFNRMGFQAGFGSRRVHMVRSGYQRNDYDRANPQPKRFTHIVNAPDYQESWVEGMVVLHNPNAAIPLPPEFVPGASHEFLQPDGRIMSMFPEFHPLFSQTEITVR